MDDEFGAVARAEAQLRSLSAKYAQDGMDLDLLGAEFLEASELGGDADALRQRLDSLSPEKRRRLVAGVDQHGRTGLLLVAQKGDLGLVDVLLDANANPNHGDNSGATALHFAASRGATPVVVSLLRACAEAGRCDDEGEEPLFWAQGPSVVRTLIRAGADVGKVSKQGRTALMRAAERGDDETVEALATSPGVDLDFADGQGRTARMLAEAAGYDGVAQRLVELGATPAAQAASMAVQSTQEALVDAARRGDTSTCQALLRRGDVSVDADVRGESALLAAVSSGSLSAAGVLLDARADPNFAEHFVGETPLLRAVLATDAAEMVWMLLESRADASKRDLSGRTPLGVAESWGKEDAAEILRAAAAGELPLESMD
eukprot:TRINITY_DN27898_c0_g1_i1.p1 TRINITY_DN27898_c0_g1~~TRINITY_DN27898_c0_g1_i1.p1  ORF type:complete len:407 (-),score=89.03 TRINITY_DN27898_c0_g1_i1:44-1168(-)